MQFVDVILPLNITGALTYGVPVQWQDKVQPGIRVEVNLGKNKLYAAIVINVHGNRPEQYNVKPVKNIIDEEPVVTPLQLKFWCWIAQYYLCSLGEVMNAALPAHLKLMSESLLNWNELLSEPPLNLSDDAFIIAEALHVRKRLTVNEVRQLLEGKNIAKTINELLEREVAIVTELLEERYKPKTERYLFLEKIYEDEKRLQQAFNDLEKAPKQLALLMQFFQMKQQDNAVMVNDLLKKAKATTTQLNALVDKGILRAELMAVDRIGFLTAEKNVAVQLSREQHSALQDIKAGWKENKVLLLHGVTGSGKTMLYIELIKEAIENGKEVLFLLPEIALTTQIVSRLRAYFGDELGVYHSRFSDNERVEIWNKVKEGKYKVVLGARSALWLPFRNLQYVIVDEEHETSYKQYEPAPRFHARDAAIYLASLHNANVLLGSATPSLESAYNAQQGKYSYVALKGRYNNVSMPGVEVVSAKNFQAALSPMLTINLLEAVKETLAQGKQVILFQNKRGYAPFLICGVCGWVPHCKNCDVSLTYHKSTDKLHCHYCGTKTPPIKHCPQCSSTSIASKSFGTEKIEEELQRIFPKVKTARMDLDSMRGKNKQAQMIDDFAKGRIDILVGTQMVVKGLDFDHVGLVGILSADSLLSYPDFRVNERAFQLMEQVSGRAGRSDGRGKVLIQTYNLKHPVLSWVAEHNYRSFYQSEVSARQAFGYPPFSRIIKLTCRHRDEAKAAKGIAALAEELNKMPVIEVKGPAPALVPRVRNYYLQEIWLKVPKDAAFIQQVKEWIAVAINHVMQQRGNSTIQIIADVDPV